MDCGYADMAEKRNVDMKCGYADMAKKRNVDMECGYADMAKKPNVDMKMRILACSAVPPGPGSQKSKVDQKPATFVGG